MRKHISTRPVKTVVYSHSHYTLGTVVIVDNAKSAVIIGHEKLNETVMAMAKAGGAPAIMPEVGPVLTARAAQQFANFLPDTGKDATISSKLQLKNHQQIGQKPAHGLGDANYDLS